MLPWAEMMRSAVSLGLRPADLWRLSLKEWRWLTGAMPGQLGPDNFAQLMSSYPDKETE